MQMQMQKQKQVTLLPLMLWCTTRRDNIRNEQSRDPKNGPKGSPSTAAWSGLVIQVPHIDAKSRKEGWLDLSHCRKLPEWYQKPKPNGGTRDQDTFLQGSQQAGGEVNSAADLEYPPSCSKSAQKQPGAALVGLLLESSRLACRRTCNAANK